MDSSMKLVSVGVAADRLQVSASTVRNWIDKGYINGVRLPSGHRKLPEAEVDRLRASIFRLPVQLEEEPSEPAPRRRRQELPPDEWGPAI
jgi:excisionase family DNA binding protein